MAAPVMDQMLFNGARVMMDMPGGTLVGLKFLLTSERYRARVMKHVTDPAIHEFWEVEFGQHMTDRERRERTLSTLNKLGALISDPVIRRMIGQPRNAVDMSEILAAGKILIVALPQGKLGIEKAALIGSLLMSQLHIAALAREGERRPFHIFADECHHFGAGSLAEMLSGIRKFGVSLTLANQYLDQLPTKLRAALIGTAGTIVSFRIGALDVPFIEPEFHLKYGDYSLCELRPYEVYVRTGLHTHKLTMPPVQTRAYPSAPRKIKNRCRAQYGTDPAVIDAKLERFITNV